MIADGLHVRSAGTLLLVEDDPDVRESATELLEEEGYCVWQAENGRDALKILETGCRPDLILLDLMMPVMTGWEFLEKLQALDASIPVCVVSGVANRLETSAYPALVSAVTKPVHWPSMLDLIDRLCHRADMRSDGCERDLDPYLIRIC